MLCSESLCHLHSSPEPLFEETRRFHTEPISQHSHQPCMGWAWKDGSLSGIGRQSLPALWTTATESLNVCLLPGDPIYSHSLLYAPLLIPTASITICLLYVQISPNSHIHTSNSLLDISTCMFHKHCKHSTSQSQQCLPSQAHSFSALDNGVSLHPGTKLETLVSSHPHGSLVKRSPIISTSLFPLPLSSFWSLSGLALAAISWDT